MKRTLVRTAVLAFSAALLAGAGLTAQAGDVTVTGTRIEKSRIVAGPGVRLYEFRVSYPVDYRDLDVTTTSGRDALQERISETAMQACMEIDAVHPVATPDNETCARIATEEAMALVSELSAAN